MLDVKRTIETAFNRANGWSFGKFPSSKENQTLTIDVQYPEETGCLGTSLDKKIKYSHPPYRLSIRRSGTNSADIFFAKDFFIDYDDGKAKAAYRLSARNGQETFNAIETPEGEVLTQGDVAVLIDLQKDPDFGNYVTFFPKENLISINTQSPKWNLTEMMERARPSRG